MRESNPRFWFRDSESHAFISSMYTCMHHSPRIYSIFSKKKKKKGKYSHAFENKFATVWTEKKRMQIVRGRGVHFTKWNKRGRVSNEVKEWSGAWHDMQMLDGRLLICYVFNPNKPSEDWWKIARIMGAVNACDDYGYAEWRQSP